MQQSKSNVELGKEQDDEFCNKLVDCLDESLNQFDEVTLKRLASARHKALKTQSRESRVLKPVGMAACLAALLAITITLNFKSTSDEMFSDEVAQDLLPTEQELDDIDMLMSLDDADV